MEALRKNNFSNNQENSFKDNYLDVYDQIDFLNIESKEKIKEILEKGLDFDEAEYFIEKMYSEGMRPFISTLAEKQDDKIENGFKAKIGWDPSESLIAGTFGMDIYKGMDYDDRISFRININLGRIKPRMTGRDKLFHGVVILDGPVGHDEIELNEKLH